MTMKDLRIVFMGTPEFSLPALEKIHQRFGIQAVVTVPDKPQGRGKKLQASPVKLKAQQLGIKIYQPEKLSEEFFLDEMRVLQPDIFVVIAFRILPAALFTIPKIASFNVHASLLPKYRGAAPINWAIINGEKFTGLTTFILQEKVDTGNIILQSSMEIPENSTAGDLSDMLKQLSVDISFNTIELLASGNYKLFPQDNSKTSPAPKIFPEGCRISWNLHSRDLRNFINGVSPMPGAWTRWNDLRLKILRCTYCSCGNATPGTFIIDKNKFIIYAVKGYIEPLEIQLQGKRQMKTKDFLLGYRGEKEGKMV